MKKLVLVLVPLLGLSLLLGVGVYAYLSPHLALRRMQEAAERGDTRALSEQVDFNAVRDSLKQQIRTRIDTQASQSQSPLAALGSALAGAIAEPAVDALVTPDSVAQMLRGDSFGNAPGPTIRLEGDSVDAGYEGLDRFVVTTAPAPNGFRLLLDRDGLLGWKLVDVRLPDAWAFPTRPPLG